jgi:anaerobic magnesium-protoporphyrin IX monomethyl ester cyclase
MTNVTLVYPYFHPSGDNSIFRFPPIGLGYIAAYLKQNGISVNLVDCTFLTQEKALERIRASKPKIIGIQSMFSMKAQSLELAHLLKKDCEVLVAGGPLPTSNPEAFLREFDVAVNGEGEQTMLDLVNAIENGESLTKVRGISYRDKNTGQIGHTPKRDLIADLDTLPFPSREMFDNESYKNYYKKKFGYTTTAIMTSRGCPFACDFCSRPVFGNTLRTRTATNIADEIEEVSSLGYERVWFADDCFTLNPSRLREICQELDNRRLRIGWECLSRVDTLDPELIRKMRQAGCLRVFFGIESGNDSILHIMNKQITTKQAEETVRLCKKEGIQTGAFFILGYPGENEKTISNTIKFASSLPLDYLSFTLPYPIPGTPLFERVQKEMFSEEWAEPNNIRLLKHKLLFDSNLSEAKLQFAIVKGMVQFYIRKYMGNRGYTIGGTLFEALTDAIYRLIT